MPIKINKAVSNNSRVEFRCLGQHNEWYLYQAKRVDGNWNLTHSPAGVTKQLGQFRNITALYKAANAHTNCL